ncbi:Presenilin-domain-containing protein, partial [Powellomyces hirtus]
LASELLSIHNLALDKITFWFFIWNLVAVGVLMIFYKGPLFLQQAYLVLMSSMMAYTLTKLPALTTWILLALLAIWDLIAVLCPFGPLRILVETAQNEEREIPALLSPVAATGPRGEPLPNVSPDSSSARETAGDRPAPSDTAAEVEEEEAARGGLKLGLGDFVFYSVLVARAALFDWITTLACTVAVLTGLNMTIFLLAMYQKALPALPISIAFGILFYFVSAVTLTPFINGLVRRPDKVIVPGAETWLWVGQGGGGGMLYV